MHTRQAATTIERIGADSRHTVWNGDARQVTTTGERFTANARHAVGNGDTRQVTTTGKRPIANTSYNRTLFKSNFLNLFIFHQ